MSVGSTLAQGRMAAGLTLEDVGAITRLRPSMLAAMEADDFSMCGGDTYARGHVRTIAIAVGIDPETVLAEFDSERANRPVASMRKDFENGRRSIDDAPRSPSWNRVIAIALAVILVLLFIGLVMRARG